MKFFEDTSASSDDVRHHGFYIVNGKNYLYRYNALVEATQTKNKIEWNFNDDVFCKINWRQPLDKPILDIYKERAQQLRDKYDYLILAYSGGSDSDNILHAFIDNNIRLEEVWVDWPHGLMDKTGFKPTANRDYENLASEWAYTIGPKLQQLAVSHPGIKIHVSDSSSQGIIDDFDDTSIIVGFRTSYQNIRRMRYICDYQQKIYDRGIDVALVTGTEKPTLVIRNNNLCARFHDLPTVFKNDITADRHTIIEYFYWTPDYPYVVVNQTHEIIKYLQRNPLEFQRLEEHMRTGVDSINRAKNLDSAINISCYPTWKHLFQTNKFVYTFESNQFNSLLLPFIHTEKFAKVYHHRYFEDSATIDPALIFHPDFKNTGKNHNKIYPVMSLQNFYQGVFKNV